MEKRSSIGRVTRRWLLVSIAATASVLAAPATGLAVTVTVPAQVLESADVTAALSATDPAGLALCVVDGTVVRSAPAAGLATVAFPGVRLAAGWHEIRVLIRSKGGLASSAPSRVLSWQRPVPAVLIAPGGGYCAQSTPVVVRAGPGTTKIALSVNGKLVAARDVTPGQVVSLGTHPMAPGVNTLRIDASNPMATVGGTFKVRRLEFPWRTCIVIDKSELRLYWVRDGVLVKIYPVAIGKPSTPTPERTWRIDAKYVTDWGSVYGPRKMRLFKQVGEHSFQYTPYGLHGTNQEWVIGTMASHGCIRMYNRDVMELYPQVPLGTMVQTRG